MESQKKSFLYEDLLLPMERIFSLAGIWPTKPTYLRFTICIFYFTVHLIMTYADLIQVFGDLELMVMNLVESMIYTITYAMVWVIRSSKLLKRILVTAREDILQRTVEDAEEERIYYEYYYIFKMFYKGSIFGMMMAACSMYLRPVLSFSWREIDFNGTITYSLPYRVQFFFTLTNTRSYAFAYLYLSPLMYFSVCHMAAICVLVSLIFQICAELSVLSYRIRKIDVPSAKVAETNLRKYIRKHQQIILIAKSLDDTFNIVLLDELLGNSIILAISMYCVLLNLGIAEMATCITFTFFALIALTILYGYCLIGEQLIQQSITIQNAFYHCNWQLMTRGCKSSILISMVRSQSLLHLTAGKFYVFSLSGFTDVVKSSLAYLSMLRTLLETSSKTLPNV